MEAGIDGITLSAGLLYMHDYEVTAGPLKGDELPFTAEFSGNLGAALVFPLADGGLFDRDWYRIRLQRRHRPVLWHLAGTQGGAPGSDRSAALRVIIRAARDWLHIGALRTK